MGPTAINGMTKQTMNYDLRSYLKIYKNSLSPELCKETVEQLESAEWKLHSFYNYAQKRSTSYEKELSVSRSEILSQSIIMKCIWDTLYKHFNEDMKFADKWFVNWNGFTTVRFNKYDTGTQMKIHCDHIQSVFDGNRKGIPILSILGALNDDYEGGDLVFWEKEVIPLKAGDIMVFPSNFLYPHEVKEVTSGTRYSFVSWAW